MTFIYDQANSTIFSTHFRIDHDLTGFTNLAELSSILRKYPGKSITIDFSNIFFFSANLCSVLGSIILRHGHSLITVKGLQAQVETIFRRNGFDKILGNDPLSDGWGSTMVFRVFDVRSGIRNMKDYISIELAGKELPGMSDGFWKRFLEAFSEIYQNSCTHSKTTDYYCVCGQFFPALSILRITYTDTGIGIRESYSSSFGKDIGSSEAIIWAVQNGNSTSKNVNGGSGFSIVRNFLKFNGGGLRIISDTGYWHQNGANEPISGVLSSRFYGTIITFEINTNDKNNYILSNELKELPF